MINFFNPVQAGILMLIAGAFGIGFVPIFVRLSPTDPIASAFWRIFFAFPLILGLHLVFPKKTFKYRSPISIPVAYALAVILGVCFALDLSLLHWAIMLTTIANSSFLSNLTPIFVAAGAWLLFKKKLKRRFIFAMGVTIFGSFLLFGQDFSVDHRHVWGDLLSCCASLTWAAYLLLLKALRTVFPTSKILLISSLSSLTILLPMSYFLEQNFFPLSYQGWLILISFAIVTYTVGQGLIAYSIERLPAALSSMILLLQPVFSLMLGWIVLGEKLNLWTLSGCGVILFGIAAATRSEKR